MRKEYDERLKQIEADKAKEEEEEQVVKRDPAIDLFFLIVKCTRIDTDIRKVRQKQADEFNSLITFMKAISQSQIHLKVNIPSILWKSKGSSVKRKDPKTNEMRTYQKWKIDYIIQEPEEGKLILDSIKKFDKNDLECEDTKKI